MNWREIEAEIVDIAKQLGHNLDEAQNGDKLIITDGPGEVNLTYFAHDLAQWLNAKAVKVKANDLV